MRTQEQKVWIEKGKKQALEEELKFLEAPIEEGSKNWVKNRIAQIKKEMK
jgi:hypothetical protein